jgi:hypothetical protein
MSTTTDEKTTTYIYKVLYHVTGADHESGYCSGADADDVDPIDRMTILFRESSSCIDSVEDLHFHEDGCTSSKLGDGSGYCNGMTQKYTAVCILGMQIKNPKVFTTVHEVKRGTKRSFKTVE